MYMIDFFCKASEIIVKIIMFFSQYIIIFGCLLGMILIFFARKIIKDGLAARIVFSVFLAGCIGAVAICKINFAMNKFVCIIMCAYIVYDIKKLISLVRKGIKRQNDSKRNSIICVALLAAICVVLFASVISIEIKYPYKIDGKIISVVTEKKEKHTRRGNHVYWDVSYRVGAKVGGQYSVGYYDLPFVENPSPFADIDLTKQHYEDMKDKSIMVRSSSEQCENELVALDEQYLILFWALAFLYLIISALIKMNRKIITLEKTNETDKANNNNGAVNSGSV